MFAKSAVAVALLASFVVAQNSTIDPNTVSATLRSQWCNGEINTCGTLCSGASSSNTCDPTTLNYTCTCTANSSTPGLQYYTQTMPTFICEQIYSNCIAAGQNDQAAQKLCVTAEANNCGHLDPAKFVAAVSSSSSSSSATATATATSSGTATAASTSATATAKSGSNALVFQAPAGMAAVGAAAAFAFFL
ncbi:hypothetical protein BP6252_00947 [Coleophoma cylindrospora]|uniref:DUF7707 domain-containing protein n=1 Tax=Coleophoma cylindrospora TaxID=1849047 RepID=A0A3D8SRI1_9HELO|nr:hypothetical protein BP6252_00947 [Coleophoma cylindrospora]